jgi:glycosyltransferase involved in cell wall biosynthesis
MPVADHRTPLLRLVAFTHDADLLNARSEAVERQLFYCGRLRLQQVALLRAKRTSPDVRHGADLLVRPCRSPHWLLFPFTSLWRALTEVRGRCHLITAQDAFLSALPAAIVAGLWRRPLVIGVFSDEIDNPAMAHERPCYGILNRLAKVLLARAAAIRTDSSEMAAKLQRLGFTRCRFVPFLIPGQESFLSVHRIPRSGSELRLIVIARLEVQKNIGLALECVSELARTHDVRLDIVGDGSQREALEAQTARLGIANRVRFHGARPYETLPGLLANADALVLTSHHETAARVLVLAALAGIPAVTTATAGASEVVRDGDTGFVVPLDDRHALVTRLAQLASEPALSTRLGEAARRSALGRFGRMRVLAGLAALYRGAA